MMNGRDGMDGTLSSRYECKYLVPEGLVPAIRSFIGPFVQPDPYSARQRDLRYAISSLYLDTPDLRLFRQTVEGNKNRFKLRLRTYSDDPSDPVFFEVKRRIDGVVHKLRSRVERDRALRYMDATARLSRSVPTAHGGDFDEFSRLGQLSGARPTMRIKYQREAYESTGMDPVRITFDSQLQHSVTTGSDFSHNGDGWYRTPLDDVIVELKFTDVFPSWVRLLIDRFELQRQSVAKYALSMEHALDVGRCSLSTFHSQVIGNRIARDGAVGKKAEA